jgi:hypothetical protein
MFIMFVIAASIRSNLTVDSDEWELIICEIIHV